MSELGPYAKALLAAARPTGGPDPATIARMRTGIAIAVGGAAVGAAGSASAATGTGATATAASGSGAATAIATKAGVTLATKVIIASVTATVVTTGTVVAVRSASTPAAHVSVTHESPAPHVAQVRSPSAAPAPVAQVVAPPEPELDIDAPSQPRSAPPARPSAPKLPLARETELIDAARAARDAGDLEAALAQLRAYARESGGRGQLKLDADALEVELLCRLHDTGAADAFAAFERKWGNESAGDYKWLIAVCSQ